MGGDRGRDGRGGRVGAQWASGQRGGPGEVFCLHFFCVVRMYAYVKYILFSRAILIVCMCVYEVCMYVCVDVCMYVCGHAFFSSCHVARRGAIGTITWSLAM